MEVAVLTPNREKAWETFVNMSSQATLAHLLGWRNVVEKTYAHKPCYLMAVEQQRVLGILPLFRIQTVLFGRFLVTAPYLSHGGLLAEDEQVGRALIEAARGLTQQQNAQYLEIRGLSQAGHGLSRKDTYCTFLLPLAHDPQALWARFEGRARKAVRKALASGLHIERGHGCLHVFTNVLNHHMRDLGTPFHQDTFYRNILAELPERSDLLMVRNARNYIGGVLLVSCKDTVLPLYGGALTAHKASAPMSLLVWEMIRTCCEQGFRYLDFGRSRWGSGTFLFKRQWGALPSPLFYEYHLGEGTRMPDVDPTNPKFRLPIEMWKNLPLPITRMLGPQLIRLFP